ncbi:MAG TPA: hypothetical protein VLY24_03055 [Bryobacteraceae bacterium]|nr:hypothetical protein [Bryobacteraceae bacterium]
MFRTFFVGIILSASLAFAPAWAQTTGQIAGPLIAGATAIKGTVHGTRTDIQLCDIDSGLLLDLTTGPTAPSDSNGAFAAQLIYPLVPGQHVRLELPPSAPTTGTEPCSAMPGATLLGVPVAVIDPGGWGRSRVTFMTGAVITNDNSFQAQSLSQASLFVDFTAEKNWVGGGVNADCGSVAHPDCTWRRRLLVNSYFQTRLASAPETQQATPASSDNLSVFIGSRKAALVEGGVYLPLLTSKWIWQNAPQALFVAPIGKAGFLTPTDSSGTTQPVNPEQFSKYYAWGARLGHFALPLDTNEAPALIDHLDVTIGRFANLEDLVPVDAVAGMTRPVREFRLAIEGVLQIPGTPLVAGFSANIGQSLAHTTRIQTANDDLRFFFGVKADLSKLLSKLPQF